MALSSGVTWREAIYGIFLCHTRLESHAESYIYMYGFQVPPQIHFTENFAIILATKLAVDLKR